MDGRGIVEGAVVADVGCGPGAVSILTARLVGPGGQVWAVDQDAQAVGVAEALATQLGLDCPLPGGGRRRDRPGARRVRRGGHATRPRPQRRARAGETRRRGNDPGRSGSSSANCWRARGWRSSTTGGGTRSRPCLLDPGRRPGRHATRWSRPGSPPGKTSTAGRPRGAGWTTSPHLGRCSSRCSVLPGAVRHKQRSGISAARPWARPGAHL